MVIGDFSTSEMIELVKKSTAHIRQDKYLSTEP